MFANGPIGIKVVKTPKRNFLKVGKRGIAVKKMHHSGQFKA